MQRYSKRKIQLTLGKKNFLEQILKKEILSKKSKKDIKNKIKELEGNIISMQISNAVYDLNHDPEFRRKTYEHYRKITTISAEDLLRRIGAYA